MMPGLYEPPVVTLLLVIATPVGGGANAAEWAGPCAVGGGGGGAGTSDCLAEMPALRSPRVTTLTEPTPTTLPPRASMPMLRSPSVLIDWLLIPTEPAAARAKIPREPSPSVWTEAPVMKTLPPRLRA